MPGKPAPQQQQVRASARAAPSRRQETLEHEREGHIDITTSLAALGMDDAKSLWTGRIRAGSPHYVLIEGIARVLLGGQTILEVTRKNHGISW